MACAEIRIGKRRPKHTRVLVNLVGFGYAWQSFWRVVTGRETQASQIRLSYNGQLEWRFSPARFTETLSNLRQILWSMI